MRRSFAGACWLGLMLVRAHGAPMVGPAQVSAEIDRIGARATIAQLSHGGQWDQVVTRIGGGSDIWLAVAGKLAPGSDAGSAEDLGIGLATALPRNPAGVLRTASIATAGTPIGLARVCSAPFIEQPPGEAADYRKRAAAAVSRVRDGALAGRRKLCLQTLALR